MTLDPTIEARVRAKRACMFEQDRDVLALLDEVERLRVRAARCDVPDCAGGWVACEGDEGVASRRPCRACFAGCRHAEALHQQGLATQRARAEKAESLLAEQTARAERAEAEAEVLLWNLGGCEVYALGNSLDQEPAAERARPALLAVLDLARRYRDRREDYEHACELVARKHAAAVGEVCGPIKGVIEDVAAVKAERDALLKKGGG